MAEVTFQDGVSPDVKFDCPDATIFGDNPELANGTSMTLNVSADAGADIRRLVMTWNISSIPAGSTISGAMLRFRKTTNTGTPKSVEIHIIGTPVDEAVTSWDVPVAGGDIEAEPEFILVSVPSGTDAAGVVSDFADIATLAQWALDNNSGILNILIKHEDTFEALSSGLLTVRSSNDATTGTRPQLVVEYTEPPAPGGSTYTGSRRSIDGRRRPVT